MPLTVFLRTESGTSVVGGFSVTVKVDGDEITIREGERCHRSGCDEHEADDAQSSPQEAEGCSQESRDNEARARACTAMNPKAKEQSCAKREGRPVLGRGEKRERVEDVGNWRERVVRERCAQTCGHRRVGPG